MVLLAHTSALANGLLPCADNVDNLDPRFSIVNYTFTPRNNTLVSHIEVAMTDMKRAVKSITIGPKSKLSELDVKLFLISSGLLESAEDTSINVTRSSSSYRYCLLYTSAFPFEITNVGNGIARYVEYYWGNQNNVDDCHFRYQITSLPVGDSRVAIVLFKSHSANYHTTASATITYHDLVGNHYFQHLNICLSISKERISLDTYTIEAPIMYFEE